VKQQWIIAVAGIAMVLMLFFFGKTSSKKEMEPVQPAQNEPAFSIASYISELKKKIAPGQLNFIVAAENSIGRGDVKNQEIIAHRKLADFYKDSIKAFEPYIYHLSEAAKLENSEKNLTFAARLLLEYLRSEVDLPKRIWMADQAIGLFDKSISLNPADTKLAVDKGACYIYGYAEAGRGDSRTMQGILALKAIADKDSTNDEANLLVGLGAVISRQFDKAISRLTMVIRHQPENVEAITSLAEAYFGKGEKAEGLKWFDLAKKIMHKPEFTKAVDKRIKELE
jgi:tetratricopeptide (TPR) repeat protein